jgi:hypothetical protein
MVDFSSDAKQLFTNHLFHSASQRMHLGPPPETANRVLCTARSCPLFADPNKARDSPLAPWHPGNKHIIASKFIHQRLSSRTLPKVSRVFDFPNDEPPSPVSWLSTTGSSGYGRARFWRKDGSGKAPFFPFEGIVIYISPGLVRDGWDPAKDIDCYPPGDRSAPSMKDGQTALPVQGA